MKKYKVSIVLDVYETSYNEGELGYVNAWDYKHEVEAGTPMQAIELTFNSLGFSFNPDFAEINENVLNYSHLVDRENDEVQKDCSLYRDFMDGKINLYDSNASVTIEELIQVSL